MYINLIHLDDRYWATICMKIILSETMGNDENFLFGKDGNLYSIRVLNILRISLKGNDCTFSLLTLVLGAGANSSR
jgi:hypothetical protein